MDELLEEYAKQDWICAFSAAQSRHYLNKEIALNRWEDDGGTVAPEIIYYPGQPLEAYDPWVAV